MAQDAELKIALKLDRENFDKLHTEMRRMELDFKMGKTSAKDLSTGLDEIGRRAESTIQSEKKLVAMQTALWHASNRASVGFKSMATEMRAIHSLTGDVAQSIQSLSAGGGNLTNVISTVSYTMQQMSVSAKSAGTSITQYLVSSITGPVALTGGLLIVINTMEKFIDNLKKIGEEAKKAGEEVAKMQGGTLGINYQMNQAQGRISTAEAKESQAAGLVSSLGIPTSLADYQMLQAAKRNLIVATKERMEAEAEYQRLEREYWKRKVGPMITLGEVEVTGTRGGTSPFSYQYGGSPTSLQPSGLIGTKEWQKSVSGAMSSRSSGAAGTEGVSTDIISPDLTNKWEGITNQMGSTLTSALTQGFMQGFQNGTNLLKAFEQAVISALMAILAQQAAIAVVSGILSIVTGGSFGVIAGALGGSVFSGSTRGGAVPVAPGGGSSISGELETINESINALNLRVDNVGLHMAVERGSVTYKTRTNG